MKISKKINCLLVLILVTTSGCSNSKPITTTPTTNLTTNTPTINLATNTPTTSELTPTTTTTDLSSHTLLIYCGAGMAKPFQEIADTFKEETNCNMQVTYANAGQLQSQINTSKEGDFFIAGSAEELKPIEEIVESSTPLVKHIPVLAVQEGNPKNISGLSDLASSDISIILGDAESTPIGKIADKALNDAGIFDQVNIISRTTTAPAIFTALSTKEADAAIVWKENVTDQSVEIITTTDLDQYVKTVPAAVLTYSSDDIASTAFLEFLETTAAQDIWQKFGYELMKQ